MSIASFIVIRSSLPTRRAVGCSSVTRVPCLKKTEGLKEHAYSRVRYRIREFSELIEREPANHDALIRRGDLHFILADYASAMADYRQANEAADEPSGYLLQRLFLTQQKLGQAGPGRSRSGGESSSRRSSGAIIAPGDSRVSGHYTTSEARRVGSLRLMWVRAAIR